MSLADEKRLALATVAGDVDLATPQGRLVARLKGSVAVPVEYLDNDVSASTGKRRPAYEQMLADITPARSAMPI